MINGIFQSPNDRALRMLLETAEAKQTALASNIANVETPGYKRVEVSRTFTDQLKKVLAGAPTPAGGMHPAIVQDTTAPSVRADGNTVQLDRELMEMSKNAADYETLTQLTAGSFRLLKSAITGNPI
jgi:flagellar basal-body rod protein FlgB